MLKKCMIAAATIAAAVTTGCVAPTPHVPMAAGITVDQRGTYGNVDNAVKPAKKGVSVAKGIILFSTGDASIDAAMRNGGITKVHHVDNEQFNILGIYAEHKTVVYGE